MSIESLIASKAYSNVSNSAGQAGDAAGAAAAPQGTNFGDMLQGLVQEAVETGQASEAQAMGAVAGESEMIDVVTAITAAEMTLETVVAVRDKVIEAYDKIMRMPI